MTALRQDRADIPVEVDLPIKTGRSVSALDRRGGVDKSDDEDGSKHPGTPEPGRAKSDPSPAYPAAHGQVILEPKGLERALDPCGMMEVRLTRAALLTDEPRPAAVWPSPRVRPRSEPDE